MCPSMQLLPGAIAAMVADISETGTLSLGDRYGLMAACLSEDLDEEERLAVNRLLRQVQRGKIILESSPRLVP